ncbi:MULTISPECIES: hypothetical protein [unclassified Gordonia (in: high G+C Gram-positive bacteria)]|uniref:hypothetical protein n=1 Tax=unclassified Gordonia (in: high G+C Gram-positive bacteria) TaxID=2657482 RepID=UPI001FFFEC66|nr:MULTISPECIES: hypothetical protein [unclassified Gordonia (in: high G+C Gram-positive bacteria)]UQE75062.1 hypothetical protein MYK68_20630 [Gordonia sp. PP30]
MNDEAPLRTWKARRPVGRGLAGGELQLTKTHVVFEPKGLAARVDGIRFSVACRYLSAVGTAPGRGGRFSRKLEMLCLTMSDGSQWQFVVDDLDDAVATIAARLSKN